MARKLPWLFKLILILAGLGLLAVLAVALVIAYRPDLAKPGLEELADSLGAKLKIEHLAIEYDPLRLELKGVTIAAEGGRQSISMQEVRIDPMLLWPDDQTTVFKLVRIKGLSATASPGVETSSHAPDPAPLAWIFLARELEILDWRVSWSQQGLNLNIFGPSISLRPSSGEALIFNALATFGAEMPRETISGSININGLMEPGPVLTGGLELEQAALSGPLAKTPIDLAMRFRLSPNELQLTELSGSMPDLRLKLAEDKPVMNTSLHIEGSGRGDLKGEALNISLSRLAIPGLVEAKGNLSFGAAAGWRGGLHGKIAEIDKLKQKIKHLIPTPLQSLQIKGALPFEASLSQAGDKLRLSAGAELQGIEAAWPEQGLNASLRGPFSLVIGTDGMPGIKGDVTVRGSLKQKQISADQFGLRMLLDLDPARPIPQSFSLSLPSDSLKIMDKSLGAGAIDLKGKIDWDMESRLSLTIISLKAQELGEFEGAWELHKGILDGWFKGKEMHASKVAALAEPWLGVRMADWQPAGSLDLKFKFYDLLKNPSMRVRVGSTGLGCSSPDGLIMAQGLNPLLDVLFSLSDKPQLNAELSIKSGQALWDTVLASFKEMPLNIKLKGRINEGRSFDQLDLQVQLAQWASLAFRGRVEHNKTGWSGDGQAEFSSQDITPIFTTFVRDTLSQSNPGLASLQVNGKASFTGKVSGPFDRLSIKGRLGIQHAGLKDLKTGPVFEGLDMDLPLAYQLNSPDLTPPAQSQVKEWGQLKLAKLQLGGVELGPLNLPLSLAPNRLYLKGELDIPLLGGKLKLSGMRVDNPLSAEYSAELAAELESFDLSRLDMSGYKLNGNLGGHLKSIKLNADGIKTSGAIKGGFMGGELAIDRISAAHPFSPSRMVSADIVFKKLDLEAVSQALDVGRITGTVTGYVKNLKVAYGQPQAFDMRLESDPGGPFDQMVSLKAVNTIAVLGTGNSLPGVGMGLFASFFKQFPYDTIGISCSLKNDSFKVKGLIIENGVEYLVKRPFWAGINVINRNQDNRFPFFRYDGALKKGHQARVCGTGGF